MNDFLEYLKDLEQGGSPVTPDELAPEPTEPTTATGTIYDERKDPEVRREALANREAQMQLREAKRGDMIAAYANNTDNPTFKGFMASEWAHPGTTEATFKKDLTWLEGHGYIGGDKQFSTLGKGYATGGEVKAAKGSKQAGPYERPEVYEEGEYAKQALDLTTKYGNASVKGTAEETFQEIHNMCKNTILRKTDKRHVIVYGDPGIGKTYEVMETCKRYMPQSPTKAGYVYEAGDIGSSMSTLVPFFYKHSQNKVIVLDDNDKMIMKGLSQDIMNIMKGLLDPKSATEKPITVRANMLKIFQARLDDLDEGDELQEGVLFEIDTEALRENRFRLSIDGEPVVDKMISLQESHDLQNRIRPLREDERTYSNIHAKSTRYLREATNKELLDDLLGQEEPDEYEGMEEDDIKAMKSMKASGATEQGDENATFPRRFLFNSSVIFVSNLEMNDINSAVLDRVEAVEVKLTLDQFLERLGKIYGGLARIGEGSQASPQVRDWAKKCVYTVIGIAIESWKANKPVFGKPIEINRKLTFRMFDEFVSAWERYAMDRAERVDGRELDVGDKAYMNKLSNDLVPEIIRRKVIPFLATPLRSN